LSTGSQNLLVEKELAPFQITRRTLEHLFSSPRLVQRLLAAGWILTVRPGKAGCEALFDYQSAAAAYDRLKNGEQPPLLRCEQKRDGKGCTQ
jgi:hypothetical protein